MADAEYFETLRTLFLFYSAAQSRGAIPGSQAGIGDLFSSAQDSHFWDAAAFWEWNLRMQVAANLSAGVPDLNAPYFALYRNNLEAIHRWTRAKMGGREGICVPETMRFNGVGVEYESPGLRPFPLITHSCDLAWPASGQCADALHRSGGRVVGMGNVPENRGCAVPPHQLSLDGRGRAVPAGLPKAGRRRFASHIAVQRARDTSRCAGSNHRSRRHPRPLSRNHRRRASALTRPRPRSEVNGGLGENARVAADSRAIHGTDRPWHRRPLANRPRAGNPAATGRHRRRSASRTSSHRAWHAIRRRSTPPQQRRHWPPIASRKSSRRATTQQPRC